jgi:preprotein translocase subunit SecG
VLATAVLLLVLVLVLVLVLLVLLNEEDCRGIGRGAMCHVGLGRRGIGGGEIEEWSL